MADSISINVEDGVHFGITLEAGASSLQESGPDDDPNASALASGKSTITVSVAGHSLSLTVRTFDEHNPDEVEITKDGVTTSFETLPNKPVDAFADFDVPFGSVVTLTYSGGAGAQTGAIADPNSPSARGAASTYCWAAFGVHDPGW